MAPKALGPGVRFHPTDVELVKYYLQKKVTGKRIRHDLISEVDVYKFSPSDLPDKSQLKSLDLEWYFFCPRERKYANGARMNRGTKCGYWKTTGRDRPVKYNDKTVGMIKTLIYHEGRAPHGKRTDWVMHEYRLKDEDLAKSGISQDAYVICKIFLKSGPGPRPTQHFFKESDWTDDDDDTSLDACPLTGSSFLSTSNMNNPDCSIVTSLDNPGRILTNPFIGAGPSKSITGLTGADGDTISLLEIPTTLKEFPSMETMQKDVSISELPQVPNSHMCGIQNTYTSHMQCQTGLHGDACSLPELPSDGKFSTWAMCSGGNYMLPSIFHGEEAGYLNDANCGGMDHPANLACPDYRYELDNFFDLGVQSGCANSFIELDDLINPLEDGLHWSHLIPSDGFNEVDNHHTEAGYLNDANCGGMDHPANLACPDYRYELDNFFDLGVQSGCANSFIELDDLITPLEDGLHWSHLIPSDGFNEVDNHHTEITSFNSKDEYGGNSSNVALAEPLLLPAPSDTLQKDNAAGNTNNLFFCTDGWRQ